MFLSVIITLYTYILIKNPDFLVQQIFTPYIIAHQYTQIIEKDGNLLQTPTSSLTIELAIIWSGITVVRKDRG